MKFRRIHLLVVGLVITINLTSCNPTQPRQYPQPPIVSSEQPGANILPRPRGTPMSGVEKQMQTARRQAGQVGKNANAPIQEDQFRFDTAAGRN